MKGLSSLQKSKLAQLARRAWQHLGRTAAEPLPDFDAWRRAEVYTACGKYGLSEATNDDFNLIAARFLQHLGEDGEAFEMLLRATSEKRRQMEHVLLEVLSGAQLDQRYAESIARARWDKSVGELNDHEFEQLLVTVKNRAQSKRRKLQEAAAA